MPKWRFYRDELNTLPYSHVDWGYQYRKYQKYTDFKAEMNLLNLL